MEETFEVQSIMDILPHRYPFILVDRILNLVPGESVTALKNVTINEPFFQGHFPGAPVMPGVMIVEAMGQAAGVLAFKSQPKKEVKELVYFTGLDKVRFRKVVVPGDQLILELKMIKQRAKMFKMSGVAKVDNKLVAEAVLMAALGG